MDRNLKFGPHANQITQKMAEKQRIINAVANTRWGWRKEYLKQLYSSFIHSISTYASFAWWPSTAKTNREKIERAQNKALRLVTGQHKATPKEALRLECGFPSLKTEQQRTIAKSAEKAERLPQDHPRSIAYSGNIRKRLKQDNWRDTSKSFIDMLPAPLKNRVPIHQFTSKPWMEAPCMKVFPELEGVTSRLEREEVKREAAIRRIREVDAPVVIYTDGSAHRGTIRGGAAAVITTGDPESMEVITTLEARGADFTCSYEEELEAMKMAAQWITENSEEQETIMVCTDSQSLCLALQSYNPETDVIREMLQNYEGSVVIQWIPGHSKIPGNDAADLAAKNASNQMEDGRPITLRSANMQIRDTFKDKIEHERTQKIYSEYNVDREREIESRQDQVLLAQLRTGKHRAFQEYAHMIDDEVPPICPHCKEENHTLEHWLLGCPATLRAKQEIFGGDEEIGLHFLTKYPARSLALARRTLLGAGHQ